MIGGSFVIVKLTNSQILALKRKHGELNISVLEMAKETGVSRWTLDKIFKGEKTNVYKSTFDKLNCWLISQLDVLKEQ